MSNLNPDLAREAKELETSAHAFAGTVAFHPLDDMIRRAGFAIHARPKRGEALWRRRGATKPIIQEAALEVAWEVERQCVE